MVGDQRLELFVVGHAGRELQQQAFAQVAGANAGRIELLHDGQRLADQVQLGRRSVGVEEVFEAACR